MLVSIILTFTQIRAVLSESQITNGTRSYGLELYERDERYSGEKFPQKFLTVDAVKPTVGDLAYYVETAWRIFDFFSETPNMSDANVAIGCFLAKATVKRTLLDYGDKIEDQIRVKMNDIVRKAEDYISHFVYDTKQYEREDIIFQMGELLRYDESLVHSIGKFNKNSIQKWIKSNITVNKFIERMDDMSLPKEDYIRLSMKMDDYYKIEDSDYCITTISKVPQPLRKNMKLIRCDRGPVCRDTLLNTHSVAYALSHKVLYLTILAMTRRCYVFSKRTDKLHMDILCGNMYRESVYLARRGHFFRDLFMEHIAICGLQGYEEFFRRDWFIKTARWIDEDGCMVENRNFEMVRSRINSENVTSSTALKRLRRKRALHLRDDCYFHQMALATNVLAHAMRHALHYL